MLGRRQVLLTNAYEGENDDPEVPLRQEISCNIEPLNPPSPSNSFTSLFQKIATLQLRPIFLAEPFFAIPFWFFLI